MKKILTLLVVMSAAFSMAQTGRVGINTENPKGTFHVDSGTKNSSADDFIVDDKGNVGIGTTSPTRKLHINSPDNSPALRIDDGTQYPNYVLTSDVNGNGSWKALTRAIVAKLPANGYSGVMQSSQNTYTGMSIDLPPGRWMVLTNLLITTDTAPTGTNFPWIRLRWSASQTTSNSNAGMNGPLVSVSYISKNIMAVGTTLINNNTSSTKTYYLWFTGFESNGYPLDTSKFNRIGADNVDENFIVAYPAN